MYIDEYKIKASEQVEMVGREEIRVNMELEQNAAADTGTVTGIVTDDTGSPISGALVKLCYASTLDPYNHTYTNALGVYLFVNVAVGSYQSAAIKEGYLMPLAKTLTVVKNTSTRVDFTLLPDPNADKNIIYGLIKSNVDNLPINDAVTQLYKVELTEDTLYATANTNENGQYYFVNVDDGEYYVKAAKLGYYTTDSANLTIADKTYSPVDISLISDSAANTGTICGVITDQETTLLVGNASVALYEIVGETETIIQLTETSVEGKYMFGNVLPGTYRVKATVQTEEV